MLLLLLLLLLKSVEFDHAVALLLSVAGLVMRPHVTSESGYSLYCAFKWARVCPQIAVLLGSCWPHLMRRSLGPTRVYILQSASRLIRPF